jgi:DNA invertase Pin-like site-specific DNA recombinase
MNPDTAIASKSKRAALYVRVSTTNRSTRNQAVFEQNPEVQELPLRQMAEQRGWAVTTVYSDRMSGSKADRPGLNALMRDARRALSTWSSYGDSTGSPAQLSSSFSP